MDIQQIFADERVEAQPTVNSTPHPASRPAAIDQPQAFSFGDFVLYPTQQLLLHSDHHPVPLGSRALAILITLVTRAGEIVSREELVAAAWPDLQVHESNLRVSVAAVRRALGDGRYIKTVALRGYCFVALVHTSERLPSPNRRDDPAPVRPAPPAHDRNTAVPTVSAGPLSRQLADHASLLNGLLAAERGVQITDREAALLTLQIMALNAALTKVLGRTS